MQGLNEAAEKTQVLLVEDEEAYRKALESFLLHKGHEVVTAASGEEALDKLRSYQPSLMIIDVALPGMSGIDVLEVLPETLEADAVPAVLVVAGQADAATAAACMQRGAFDYLTKPVDLDDLDRAITRALRKRISLIRGLVVPSMMREELTLATLDALVAALEAKSIYLAGHSDRVAALAATIANELDLSDDDVEQVRIAGRLHDLGMIGIRDSVVDKKDQLTDEEYAHIKEHVTIGSRILSPLVQLGPVVSYVRTHHEHWDGTGYPSGLSGEFTPLGGRILGACEVYDALTTRRPYQEVLEPAQAVERMREIAGSIVDPTVVDAFATAVGRHQTLMFPDEE